MLERDGTTTAAAAVIAKAANWEPRDGNLSPARDVRSVTKTIQLDRRDEPVTELPSDPHHTNDRPGLTSHEERRMNDNSTPFDDSATAWMMQGNCRLYPPSTFFPS